MKLVIIQTKDIINEESRKSLQERLQCEIDPTTFSYKVVVMPRAVHSVQIDDYPVYQQAQYLINT